jgi:hypothetical protein
MSVLQAHTHTVSQQGLLPHGVVKQGHALRG